MKLISIIILSLVCLSAPGQRIPYEAGYYERDSLGKLKYASTVFTKETNKAYYNKAIHAIATKNQDSLVIAYYILKELYKSDPSKYSKSGLKDNFLKIEKQLSNYYRKTIIGTWIFKWSGSNWGTGETSASRNSKIIFTDTEAFFYNNDTLARKTKYLITNKFSDPFSKTIYFNLYFTDNNATWDFKFETDGADYISNIKFSKDSIGLWVNEMPECSCGCPESIYIKETSKGYITAIEN